MGNFQLPRTTVLDGNGDPVSGAKLYFYLTATSTPEAIYQDEANTTPHTNPVIADSAGRVLPIYLNTAKTYKLVVKDSGDVTLYTVDPLKGYALIGSDISTRLRQVASTPLDYGAVGDGVANESAAVQAAVDAATGTVDLLGKTYRCDTQINLRSGLRLLNGTLDFSNCTQDGCLRAIGTYGSEGTLTADAEVGATTLQLVSTSGLAAGGWLRLFDTRSWYTSIDAGELVQIKSVDSGVQVTLTSKTLGQYVTVSSAKVAKLTLVSNVAIEDVKLIGAQSVTQSGIIAAYCENLSLRDVKLTGFYTYGIDLRSVVHSSVSRCDVRNMRLATTGVGISMANGCKHVTVEHCRIDNAPVGIEVGGNTAAAGDIAVCRSLLINACNVSGTGTAGVWLKPSQYISVRDCIVSCGAGASSDGIVNNGCDNTVRGCTIRHPTRYGVYVLPQRSLSYSTAGGGTPASKLDEVGAKCTDNVIEFPGADGIRLETDTGSLALAGVEVARNDINGAGVYGIYANLTHTATNLRIDNNMLSGCGDTPVYLAQAAAKTLRRFSVAGNIAEGHGATKDGIQVLGGDISSLANGRVDGNTIVGGQRGIKVTNASHVRVIANECNTPSTYGISYENTTASAAINVEIGGNTIATPGATGILVSAAASASISRVNIHGNNIHDGGGDVGDHGISVAAVTSGGIVDCAVTGNTVQDGMTGVYGSNVSGLTVSGNVISDSDVGGINIEDCSFASAVGNTIKGWALYGVQVVSSSSALVGASISGNTINNGNGNGIRVAASGGNITGVTISGNTISAVADMGIKISATDPMILGSLSIIGNTIHYDTGNDKPIELDAGSPNGIIENFVVGANSIYNAASTPCISLTGLGNARYGLISGNVIRGGTYAAEETTGITRVVCPANYCIDQTSGVFNGTFTYAQAVSAGTAAATDLPSLFSS